MSDTATSAPAALAPAFSLQDRVALVFGGGSSGPGWGNGKATAVTFARAGATVVVIDINAAAAEETRAIIAAEGGRAEAAVCDVTKNAQIRELVDDVAARHGRIDVLHNNVGRSEGDAPTTQLSEQSWLALMDINLKSVFLACKHTLPVMREQRSGVIINISSTSSVCTRQTLAYKTGKAGINAMTQNMAIENAPFGIRVNAILPGLMDTPMAIERRARERNVDRDVVRRERDAEVPLNARMGTAWDVANAALWLASDEAAYVTGVLLPVDGGLSARVG
jgi:NAD(P)-dependent dehydrogenase (short-subunit alcohol dehydrogenase family)